MSDIFDRPITGRQLAAVLAALSLLAPTHEDVYLGLLAANAPKARSKAAETIPAGSDLWCDCEAVIAHFLTVHPSRRRGAKDQRTAARALGYGYTVTELREAIDGNARDPWHVEKGKHELSYVLRNVELIDGFRARAEIRPMDDYARDVERFKGLPGWPDTMTDATGAETPFGRAMSDAAAARMRGAK